MNGTRKVLGLAPLALCLILGIVRNAGAQAPAPAQDAAAAKGPQYTLAEYNSYKACEGEASAAAKIKCLDDFVSKYPNSGLLNFVYIQYSQAYGQQKNYLKMMETADKLAALGDKIDPVTRVQAYLSHALTYVQMLADPANKGKGLDKDTALAKAAQQAASDALKTLADAKKPEAVTDDAWNKQKLAWQISANNIAAQAAMNAKDCASAANSYKAELALNPDNAVSMYQLGRVYQFCMNPGQYVDAFWYYARAITSKGATQAQADQIKKFLRSSLANYQGGNVCDSLTDGEMNELLQLAGTSAERPGSYSLPSGADIAGQQKGMTILTVFNDLKAGGDKGKLTWLAACGLEFPDVQAKLLEVVPDTDTVLLKMAFVTNQADFEATTTPNMDVKITGQPQAAKLEKDSAPRFTGALASYDPDPTFFLHWDKAKVNEEDLPKEKAAPKKPVRKPAARKPAAKP